MRHRHGPRAARRVRSAVVLLCLAVVAATSATSACSAADPTPRIERSSDRGSVDHDYVVPPGTWERIAGGEDVALVPRHLDVAVGDRIRIRNDDRLAVDVGIFHVAAHQTVTMRFASPGRLEGSCDVHPDGRFTIDVHDGGDVSPR